MAALYRAANSWSCGAFSVASTAPVHCTTLFSAFLTLLPNVHSTDILTSKFAIEVIFSLASSACYKTCTSNCLDRPAWSLLRWIYHEILLKDFDNLTEIGKLYQGVNISSFIRRIQGGWIWIATIEMKQSWKTSQELRMLSLSQAIHDHKVILNNVVLNCQQCNQCLKCHM